MGCIASFYPYFCSQIMYMVFDKCNIVFAGCLLGLQMLHNIMKRYRREFNKTPILRKLLKVI